MCKVIIADNAGFCFGVQRAIDRAFAQKDKKVYTYGSLIHNEEVMKDLANRGIVKIDDVDHFASLEKGTVIIRSHGISYKEEKILIDSGHNIIDTTCPYVKKIHKIVRRESEKGRTIIIIGDRKHPELKGIMGWCVTEPIVIRTEEEARNLLLNEGQKGLIVAQTTFNLNNFNNLVEIILKKSYDINVLDTICQATEERQLATKQLASAVDVMIVVGDKRSSNTQKLYDISADECKETYYIQTASDMDFEKLVGKKLVGITAGASTPKKIIEEVKYKCQRKILSKC